MFGFNRNEGQSNKELDFDKLPLPVTVQEILKKNPAESPVKQADFDRVKDFFTAQEQYFKKLAQEDPQSSEVLLQWVQRLPQLYKVIESQTRVFTQKNVEHSLPKMKKSLEQTLGKSEYRVFLHGKNPDEAKLHSTFYLARQLALPERLFVTDSDLNNPDVREHLKAGGKMVIVDDGAYSAQNIGDHLYQIQKVFPEFQPKNLIVSVVGTTKTAHRRLKEYGIENVQAQYRIPELSEVFQGDDRKILRFLERRDSEDKLVQIPSDSSEVLTLFWQKVPDNFCHPLRKMKNKYWDGEKHHFWPGYLVDDTPTGIHPPYRGGKTFIFS